MRQRARQQLRRDVDDRDHALVGHAGRADHAQYADHLAVDFIRRGHDAALVERHQAGFAADENLHAVRPARDVEQLQQAGFLFEQFKQVAQTRHVGRQVLHLKQVALA